MTRPDRIKVLLVCTGLGIMNRGIESFFRECFDGLHPLATDAGVDLTLLKGRGKPGIDEKRVWCLPRTGLPARLLGKVFARNGYVAEQWSSVPGIVRHLRLEKPHLLVYSDVNMAMRIQKLRPRLGVEFAMLYSNGAPLKPPFTHCDHVQQLAPFYLDQAIAAGENPAKHSLVPYGFTVPTGQADFDRAFRQAARRELGLPKDRKILLSVGWISAVHKRMDYLISEISQLPPETRPYLVMLGAMDEQDPPILSLAHEKLGPENFAAHSVPYAQVFRYYHAADFFALCSLTEGFGRVHVEAAMHGLPCAAHDHPVMRYVLGDLGRFADFSKPGGLARILQDWHTLPVTLETMVHRRQVMRDRFAWPSVAPAYFEMFRKAAATQ